MTRIIFTVIDEHRETLRLIHDEHQPIRWNNLSGNYSSFLYKIPQPSLCIRLEEKLNIYNLNVYFYADKNKLSSIYSDWFFLFGYIFPSTVSKHWLHRCSWPEYSRFSTKVFTVLEGFFCSKHRNGFASYNRSARPRDSSVRGRICSFFIFFLCLIETNFFWGGKKKYKFFTDISVLLRTRRF